MKRLATLLLILMASGFVLAWAEEGRIPIAAPGTITAPGHYILTRDIAVASGDAILIDAEHVILDLNGHRISTTATDNTLIHISSTADFVTIRDGHLSGGASAISGTSSVGIALFMDGLMIDGCSSDAIGIIGAANVELSNSRLINNNAGVYVEGLNGGIVTGRITGNTIGGSNICLVLLSPKGVLISDNMITTCGNQGIQVGTLSGLGSIMGGNLIEHNTITNSTVGINILAQAGGNQVVGNVLQGNGIAIVVNSDSNRIAENTIFASNSAAPCGAGICVEGPRTLIEGNRIGGSNPGCGLLFYGAAAIDNSWRNNMLRGNTGGAVCFVGGGTGSNDGGNVF